MATYPEDSQGQRSLAGYSPRGGKESGRTEPTEHAHTHTHMQAMIMCPHLTLTGQASGRRADPTVPLDPFLASRLREAS